MNSSKLLLLAVLLVPLLVMGQSKVITIKDPATGEVIPDVNVQYANTNEGTISNLDGMANLTFKDTITLSHLAYGTKKIAYSEYSTANIIYLESAEIILNEVVVSNFDLKAKLKYVLENYSDLYVAGEKSYTGTYKETFRANDSLLRLFQVQMQWWTKDYELVFQKSWTNQSQFEFLTTDYHKVDDRDIGSKVSTTNSDFLKSLYLNHYLYFLIYTTSELDIFSVERKANVTKVVFDASYLEDGIVQRDCRNCEIYLDDGTGAVVRLINNIVERGSATKQEGETKSGQRITTVTRAFNRELNFTPQEGKLRLNKAYIAINADVITNGETIPIVQEQIVYLTDMKEGIKIPKNERLNLLKDFFFEGIPEVRSNSPIILLTLEERKFVATKN